MRAISHRALIASAVVVASAVGSPAASAVTLTLLSSGIYATARDGTALGSGNAISSLSLPWSGAAPAVEGASASTTSFALSNDIFALSFDHVRATTVGAYARSQASFTIVPSENVHYSISGSYASDSPDPRVTILEASLIDSVSSIYLYWSRQESYSTAYESFTLGGSGADTINSMSGQSAGILLAGHAYGLNIISSIAAGGTGAPSAAHGAGGVTVTFVPEPSVGLLLISGGAAFAAVARRFRKPVARD